MEKNEYEIMYALESSYWWFLGKQFLVRDQLQRLAFGKKSESRILDIGSGTGMNLKTLGWFGQTYGTEISLEAMRFLKKRGMGLITCSDANHSLPFKAGVFSVVTCLDVLEHLDRDDRLLTEMARVCKPGGYLLITVPAFQMFWSPHDVALHHRRRYTKSELLDRTKGIPCRVIKVSYFNLALSIPIMAFRKTKSMIFRGTRFQSDFFLALPGVVNGILTVVFKLEICLLRYLNLPFGVSLVLILQKHQEEEGQLG